MCKYIVDAILKLPLDSTDSFISCHKCTKTDFRSTEQKLSVPIVGIVSPAASQWRLFEVVTDVRLCRAKPQRPQAELCDPHLTDLKVL